MKMPIMTQGVSGAYRFAHRCEMTYSYQRSNN